MTTINITQEQYASDIRAAKAQVLRELGEDYNHGDAGEIFLGVEIATEAFRRATELESM